MERPWGRSSVGTGPGMGPGVEWLLRWGSCEVVGVGTEKESLR